MKEINEIYFREKNRESGLEILRIIAMFLILIHHITMHNSVIDKGFLTKYFELGGKLGVNIFILISSYFMWNKKFKIKRILSIVFQTIFYCVIIDFAFIITGKVDFSFRNFIYDFIPIYTNRYGFVSNYIVLLLVSPGINIIIENINQKQHISIVAIISFFVVIMPNVFLFIFGELIDFPVISYFLFFVCLYFVGSYISKYNVKIQKSKIILILGLCYLIKVCSLFIMYREIDTIWSFGNYVNSVCLLILFKDLKFTNKIINKIASTTFGIYLIHENSYFRQYVWNYLLSHFPNYSSNYILAVILIAIFIFVVCSIIDYIRQITIHKWWWKLIDNISLKIKNKNAHS